MAIECNKAMTPDEAWDAVCKQQAKPLYTADDLKNMEINLSVLAKTGQSRINVSKLSSAGTCYPDKDVQFKYHTARGKHFEALGFWVEYDTNTGEVTIDLSKTAAGDDRPLRKDEL
tara:strand:+ start:2602 stop:2949 length:348 start_codon:yes stop_codon:yes gene_type:complete